MLSLLHHGWIHAKEDPDDDDEASSSLALRLSFILKYLVWFVLFILPRPGLGRLLRGCANQLEPTENSAQELDGRSHDLHALG